MEFYLREKLEYWIVLFFMKFVKFVPEKLTFVILNFFGKLAYLLLSKRRKLTIKNISLAFPSKNNKEAKALAYKNFLSIARTIAEILLIVSKKQKLEDFVENKEEALERYLEVTKERQENQGMIFISGHFGNWELFGNYFASKGLNITAIGRRGDNRLIEDNITTPFRESYGNLNVHKSEAINAMIKTLRDGGRVGILIDQKAGSSGLRTTFFGRECSTTASVAIMKLKYKPLIIPGFAIRQESGKSKLVFFEPVEYVADEKESKEERLIAITQKYNDVFENIVKEYPEQWFWMHNRWKI